MPTPEEILHHLRGVKYPGYSRDIVSFGMIRSLAVDGGRVSFLLKVASGDPGVARAIEEEARRVLRGVKGVETVEIRVEQGEGAAAPGGAPPPVAQAAEPLPGIRHVVAVASGKGGVGKSTVTANLAVALQRRGQRVGVLDADIYGPSQPRMLGVRTPPVVREDKKIVPAEAYGLKMVSIGFFIDEDAPVVWRAPMVVGMMQQFLRDVLWGDLDLLLVDLPPGTGDAQLTLIQRVPLSGAVVVTTPQDAAFTVARRGLVMFQKLNVPVLGVIENMSYFHCPHCGERTDIFSHGGGRHTSEELHVPFLGEIPLEAAIRKGSDEGAPCVVAQPDAPAGKVFGEIAGRIVEALASGAPKRLKIIQ